MKVGVHIQRSHDVDTPGITHRSGYPEPHSSNLGTKVKQSCYFDIHTRDEGIPNFCLKIGGVHLKPKLTLLRPALTQTDIHTLTKTKQTNQSKLKAKEGTEGTSSKT